MGPANGTFPGEAAILRGTPPAKKSHGISGNRIRTGAVDEGFVAVKTAGVCR